MPSCCINPRRSVSSLTSTTFPFQGFRVKSRKIPTILRGVHLLIDRLVSLAQSVENASDKGLILPLNRRLSSELLQVRIFGLVLAANRKAQQQHERNGKKWVFHLPLPDF